MLASYVAESDESLVRQVFAVARPLVGMDSISFRNALELFRYPPGGHFSRHVDSDVQGDDWGDKWQSTLLLYFRLPTGCNCGTAFPHLRVNANPQEGDGIYFFNIHTDGAIDPFMAHGGCPVPQGDKWSAFIGFHANDSRIGATCHRHSPIYFDLWHHYHRYSL